MAEPSVGLVGRMNSNANTSNGTNVALRLNRQGSLMVDSALPARAELARAGRRFYYSGGVVANAGAPVQDIGTTTALRALWNGEPQDGTGRSLVIEQVSAIMASGTAGLGTALLAGVTGTVQAAAVANGTGVVLGKAAGQSGSSLATFGTAITLAANPGWIAIGSLDQAASVSIGAGIVVDLNGLFIVPPGKCLALTVIAPAGTSAKFTFSVVWSELALDLES